MRLFVALDIPEDVRAAIGAFVETLRPTCRSAKWARMENAYITLKFLGEVSSEKVELIRTALTDIRHRSPIHIIFRGTGFFPDVRRPRVFWTGIEAGPELGSLAMSAENILEPLGFPKEKRTFSPHLTLARLEPGINVSKLQESISAAGALGFGQTVAEEFHLYQSVLKRSGAEYTRLVTYRLDGSREQ